MNVNYRNNTSMAIWMERKTQNCKKEIVTKEFFSKRLKNKGMGKNIGIFLIIGSHMKNRGFEST